MTVGVFRFSFSPDVRMDEVEMTLQLATLAAEGLFGAARVRLDFGYHLDTEHRAIVVDGSKEIGAAVVQVFMGFLSREFGADSFTVVRVTTPPQSPETAT